MNLAFINWNPNPDIFSIADDVWLVGGLTVRYYGLLFAGAFFFGYLVMSRIFKKENMEDKQMERLTIYMAIGTIIGARLGHCLFYQPGYYFSHPLEILKIWEGGLASHGGAFGILTALYIFSKKAKKPYIWILDRIVIVVALAGLFIRSGNLMNSEIVGKASSLPWAFYFPRNDCPPPWDCDLSTIDARHPAQLYEALAYFVIFIVLFFLYHKRNYGNKPGILFSIFLISLFSVRFLVEFIKDIQVKFESNMIINMGQILSIPFILFGAGLLIWSVRKQKTKEVST
ncbi:MAG: prolipoprotein diacylglyceryl transferase [Bacteroidota bacterium]